MNQKQIKARIATLRGCIAGCIACAFSGHCRIGGYAGHEETISQYLDQIKKLEAKLINKEATPK
jgi:hypothetical protein